MTEDPFLREDLMQEAVIHFWKTEGERPGQTLSWYIQSCSFHVRHCLAAGRSVDSRKRRALRLELPEDEDACDLLLSQYAENSVVGQIEAREIIQLLWSKLAPRERAVLQGLIQGLGSREIGRHIKLSHPTVIKCRRRIAIVAIRLGMEPSPEAKPLAKSRSANRRPTGREIHGRSVNRHAADLRSVNGHAVNGHSANGHSVNGHAVNGHSPKGHGVNGHSANGHSHNGHALNGYSANGHSQNGQAANGHSANGLSHNGHAVNGHSANGHSHNGHALNGHSANGHSHNGHSVHGHAADGSVVRELDRLPTQSTNGNEPKTAQ